MLRLLLLAVVCAALAACAPARPLTDSEVYSFCLMGGSMIVDDTCDSEQDICNAYRDVVSTPYTGLNPCLVACQDAYEKLVRVQYVGNCFTRIIDGQDICIQYCRREYPKQ
jgi:hypothetical protein